VKNRTQKVPSKGRSDRDYLNLSLASLGYCLIQQAFDFSTKPSQIIEDSLQRLIGLKSLTGQRNK